MDAGVPPIQSMRNVRGPYKDICTTCSILYTCKIYDTGDLRIVAAWRALIGTPLESRNFSTVVKIAVEIQVDPGRGAHVHDVHEDPLFNDILRY